MDVGPSRSEYPVVMRKIAIDILTLRCFGRRRNCLVLAVLWSLLLAASYSFLGDVTKALLLPPPTQDLVHFRRSKALDDYLNDINVLIEPSSVPCEDASQMLVLVASAPLRYQAREAVRRTWGKYLQTYFVLGRHGDEDEEMVDNYVEAKKYGDIIMFDLRDHYQNLTIKSVLMLQWTRDRCPGVEHLFKTDDDVLVNPWVFEKVVKEHPEADLLGYMVNNSYLHRDPYNKWFVPRWLYSDDYVPRYLSGTGYVIKGSRIDSILNEARNVPLINLEDVYLTYVVAHRLNYTLKHDYRLSPYKPWIDLDCAYWSLGSIHSLKPVEMVHAWTKIKNVAKYYTKDENQCSFYKKYLESQYFLF